MISFATIEHIEIMREKDLVHIVKVSDDTFVQPKIIPIFGIMLCVLSLNYFYLRLLWTPDTRDVPYVVKNISILIITYLNIDHTNFLYHNI
jgi:hypothetical protein